MNDYHVSVLLHEAIDYLDVKSGDKYIDATIGGGGHTEAILKKGGRVLGIDADKDSIEYIKEKFRIQNSELRIGENLILVHGNFREIEKIASENGFESVSGVLFDLGVSSKQLETPERGFSFSKTGPLDMRMERELSVTAADLVNGLTRNELTELFFKFGEEGRSRIIANSIVEFRKNKLFETTQELRELIESVVRKEGKTNPATKVFQALRIAVNDELFSLKQALPQAMRLLKPGGRLVVISFHSLEDRIVKEIYIKFENEGVGKIITKKPVIPTDDEINTNPRSRSAKFRVVEKMRI